MLPHSYRGQDRRIYQAGSASAGPRRIKPTVIPNDPFDRLCLAFGQARLSMWYRYGELIAATLALREGRLKSQGENLIHPMGYS